MQNFYLNVVHTEDKEEKRCVLVLRHGDFQLQRLKIKLDNTVCESPILAANTKLDGARVPYFGRRGINATGWRWTMAPQLKISEAAALSQT